VQNVESITIIHRKLDECGRSTQKDGTIDRFIGIGSTTNNNTTNSAQRGRFIQIDVCKYHCNHKHCIDSEIELVIDWCVQKTIYTVATCVLFLGTAIYIDERSCIHCNSNIVRIKNQGES
jgi:hypothetical protein